MRIVIERRKDEMGMAMPTESVQNVFISHCRNENDPWLRELVDVILEEADCNVAYASGNGEEYSDEEVAEWIAHSDALIAMLSQQADDCEFIWGSQIKAARDHGIPVIPVLCNYPAGDRIVERRLGLSIPSMSMNKKGFADDLKSFLGKVLVPLEEERQICALFASGRHLNAFRLSKDEILLMAKGYGRGIGVEKNMDVARKYLSVIITGFETRKDIVMDAIFEKLIRLWREVDGTTKQGMKALSILKKDAMDLLERGDSTFCFIISDMYRFATTGMTCSPADAILWLCAAAGADDADAMYALGVLYINGMPYMERDARKAYDWYDEAAGKGVSEAYCAMAEIVARGLQGMRWDNTKAVSLYQKAAAKKNAEAYRLLGITYERGLFDEPKDMRKAIEMYQEAASLNDWSALEQIADIYMEGNGVRKDPAYAALHYRRAAEAGNVRAMSRLGELYLNGAADFEQDKEMAKLWLERAVNEGASQTAILLGSCYREGLLEAENADEKALYYYEKAAELDPSTGGLIIGTLLKSGFNSIRPNVSKAIHYFECAKEEGNRKAIMELIDIYSGGCKGVVPDRDKAIGYLKELIEMQGDHAAEWERIGDIYLDNACGEVDIEQAANAYRKAGTANALAKLSNAYSNIDNGVEYDEKKQIVYMIRSALKGGKSSYETIIKYEKDRLDEADSDILILLGDFYRKPFTGYTDPIHSIELYTMAWEKDDPKGYEKIADLYSRGQQDFMADPDEALVLYRQAAEAGDGNAMRKLGKIYESKQDGANAVECFRRALDMDLTDDHRADVLWCLSQIYEKGKLGIEQDIPKALELLEESKRLGRFDSALHLSHLYRYGDNNVEINLRKSIEIMEYILSNMDLNEEKRNRAIFELTDIYEKNNEFLDDANERIMYWFTKLAESGHGKAQSIVASIHRFGKYGQKPDDLKAEVWARRAARKRGRFTKKKPTKGRN